MKLQRDKKYKIAIEGQSISRREIIFAPRDKDPIDSQKQLGLNFLGDHKII